MASPPDRNLVINAALAEYTAPRAEVTNRITGQDTILNLYMTATAAIFALALSGHADSLIFLVVRCCLPQHGCFTITTTCTLGWFLHTSATSLGRWSQTVWKSLACSAGSCAPQNINADRGGAGLCILPSWRCSSRSPQLWRRSWSCPGLPPRGRG